MAGESTDEEIETLLRHGADQERRLLRRERRAEREVSAVRAKLVEDEARLERARRRAERRRSDVADAEGVLRRRQTKRAKGASYPDSWSESLGPAGER